MLHILDLPDEVLCKIFEYLSSFDALYSFINLNHRFNCLLTPFKQQIDLTSVSYQQFLYYINNLLPILNQNNSLNIIKLGNKRTPGQIKLFNTIISNENIRQYFNQIEQILLEYPRLNELIDFINKYILFLPNLINLSIKITYIRDEDFQKLTQLIINSIFSLINLHKLSLKIPSGLNLSRLTNTITFNSLKYLNLNLSLLTDLFILLPCIPNIEKLFISINWWTSGDRTLVKILDNMKINSNKILLKNLKLFYLYIHSILTFQFEHLEQILYQILNKQITKTFYFILNNGLIRNNESIKLLDGKLWENLLKSYPLLINFNLFIRINNDLQNDDDLIKINLFQSKFFKEKNWNFSYLEFSNNNNRIFYSIPYKFKQTFDIILNDKIILENFSINYSKILSINQINYEKYQINKIILNFIEKYFPFIEELNLNQFNIDLNLVKSINILSLHILKIEKERNINLFYLLQLFPLINTLFLSYFSLDNQNKSLDFQYKRIKELSLIDIPEMNINEILIFLNQFPNLNYLYIHINNRRISNEILFENINNIIKKFPLLICLTLQLGKNIESSINLNEQLNNRIKMSFTDIIFDGILIHLWF